MMVMMEIDQMLGRPDMMALKNPFIWINDKCRQVLHHECHP